MKEKKKYYLWSKIHGKKFSSRAVSFEKAVSNIRYKLTKAGYVADNYMYKNNIHQAYAYGEMEEAIEVCEVNRYILEIDDRRVITEKYFTEQEALDRILALTDMRETFDYTWYQYTCRKQIER